MVVCRESGVYGFAPFQWHQAGFGKRKFFPGQATRLREVSKVVSFCFRRRMENTPLKILLISGDETVARRIGELLQPPGGAEVTVEPSADSGLAMMATINFAAVLFQISEANAAALFQITSLTAKAPRLPVVVIGPGEDDHFLAEAVFSGAQDYLAQTGLTREMLRHTIHGSIARHQERMELVAEKDNYYGVFDHLVEGVFRTTMDGHYLLANIALSRIYGYGSPLELMASIKDIAGSLYVEPGRREEFIRLMQASDTLSGFQSRIYRKDGSVIWIEENCRAVRDLQGKLLYYEGTVEDITQQRQMEEALQRSESLYHSLVETMPQGVFRRDLQGRFTFANQTYCKYVKRQLEELLGKSDFDLFPRELAEKYWRDDLALMQKGETMEITEETRSPGSADKTYHHVIKTPLWDEGGRVIGLQGMFWDITEKIRAEEQIRRTTAELARSREELQAKNNLMLENLHTAREIQLVMLPQQYPAFPPGVPPERSAFQFVHRYEAAESVSGDFFTISALSEHEVGVFICDVTGHGIRAALVTAMIRALGEELKPLAHDPGLFMRKLNHDLCAILKNTGSPMLTTAFYGVADCRTGLLRFANAGHPKPLVVRRSTGRVEMLLNNSGRSQPALGLFEDPPYTTSESRLVPGDLLMLFTDGLYEVQGQHEEFYSQERLMMDVKNLLRQPSGTLFDELLRIVRGFAVNGAFDDDVCLVGLDYAAPPEAKS
jgi:sigma-B regulation protein RsbU (phosphoserine phosphatase)